MDPAEASKLDLDGAPQTFSDGQQLPSVLVFDLDYTLWNFWVDTHVTPPFKSKNDGKRVVDSTGQSLGFFREVPGILAAAYERSITLALASRTCTPDLAEDLLKKLNVSVGAGQEQSTVKAFDLFRYRQIYPGDKRTHLKRISSSSGVAFEDILFFDDESRNRNVETLGVCFWLVGKGISKMEVDNGIKEWRRRKFVGS